MSKSFATAAFAAALALALSATTAHGQKALVYCPVGVDVSGCDRIVSALQSKFADGVDRGFDGTSGTVDLKKADLNHYAVFVVPSLADDDAKQPYAVLRAAALRLHMAINGRVAVYSGAPDQGAGNRADKDALIQNLARWAADGHTRTSSLVGLVAFLDLSETTTDRYSWVRSISTVDVSADDELQTFGDITPVTTRGGDMFSTGGRAVKFSNMASYGLHIGGHAAARTEVSAMGGGSSRQSVLVQYSNAEGDAKATSGGSTGKVGSSGASFSVSSGTSASLSTSSSTSGPTLATDKPDYMPGDTVTFSGTGWVAGDTVTITIHEDPQWTTEDRTVTAVADGSGNFSNHTFVVDQHDYGVTFTATAVGNPSGLVAQMTFTDGNLSALSSLAPASGTVAAGNSVAFSFTVKSVGNNNLCTIQLSVSGLPTGATGSFDKDTVAAVGVQTVPRTLTVSTIPSAPPVTNASFTVTATSAANCQNNVTEQTLGTLTISAAANTPPVAANDNYNTNEDVALTIPAAGVLSNDTDAENNTLTAVRNGSTTGPSNGSLTLNANGSFTYTPNANFNGTDTFTYFAFDGTTNSATAATVTITVSAVNDAPSFTKGADQTVLEDAAAQSVVNWATAISAGPANENTQVVDFVVSNDNNALFSAQPAIAANGTLTYTAAANAFGVATVTAHAHDNGGTANSGVDASADQTFTITITAVNDAPSFTKGADQTVLEDAGAQTVNAWATALSAGPANEAGQTLTFAVTGNTNAALFSAGPAISAAGNLTYTPAANANGTATITIKLTDNGGTANGGIDASAEQTFVINVTAVNDAPSFTKGADQTVNEDAAAQTANGWATAISAGPNETQTVAFTVTNNNNALFSSQPSIDATGKLTYTPAPDAFGVATVSVTLKDDGGTANSGVDTSAPQTFTITINAVNDAPSFVKGANQSVNEDAGLQTVVGWATAISAGPANESAQTLTFVVTSNSNAALFSGAPAVAANGTLTYTPAANASGTATITLKITDNGGTANGGVDASADQTFTITVASVNDAPVFTKGVDQTVLEDAAAQSVTGWATGINAGAPDESGQTLTFSVTGNTNTALFAVQPTVNPTTGALTYTPAADAFGSATITLTLSDNGGTANGGVDTSAPQSFTITIKPVNDAPSFTKGADQTKLEDAGAQTVSGWATAISKGPANESGQTLTFTVTNDNNGLFSAQPAIDATGQLTYTSAPNANGSATVSVVLKDNGGTLDGGVDTAPTQTFTITITAVNDAPSFTKGANQTVLEDAGAQTVAGWATAISAGPADEASQTLTFGVSNNNNALFSVQPTIDATGKLTYTPAADANGTATVTVSLTDNGGTVNSGVDTSAPQTFTINVTAVNDAPSFTKGADQTVNEDAGAQSVSGWATAISAGPANESSQIVDFVVSNDNNGLFTSQPAVDATGKLTYTPAPDANGSATVTIHIHDNGGTANSGVDASANQTFTITVNAVNDAPTFGLIPSSTVLEDAGAQSVSGALTSASPGPTNENTQTLSLIVTNNNNGLFSAQPSIDLSTGILTYTPAANANGSATVTVTLKDNGGTAFGGVDTAKKTLTITVTPVNDAPSFTKGANQTTLEDAGAQTVSGWATAVSAGPPDEAGQALNFIVTNDNNPLFSVQPAISAAGQLSYTAAPNANGSATVTVKLHDDGGTANLGVDTSPEQTFTITITPVNDAPSFTKGADQTVLEDAAAQTVGAWATAISAGPTDESVQAVDFVVSNNNNGLFSVQPTIAANGTLTYTPAADAFGVATVTVRAHDTGGTLNSGVDTSAPQTFTINVTAVNDAPSFTKGADQTVNEDAGAQSVSGWATAISAGPANESSQAVDFVVSNNNNGLFSSQPAVDATGKLTYTSAPDANGSATVTIHIHDNGGTANSGVDASADQTFTITVNAVNDAPTFGLITSHTVPEDAGAQSVSGALTSASPGPTNENTQTLSLVVTNNNNGLFSAQPSIDLTTGILTYTPAANANGSATVTVTLKDNGGTAFGGVDTTKKTLTITVTPVNDAPVITDFSSTLLPVAVNTSVLAAGTFQDVDLLDSPPTDSHTGTIDWGDGTPATAVAISGSGSSRNFNGSHSYAAAGVYTVVARITDAHAASDDSTYRYVVVYDPNAGFVTGGGWINSPAGAYTLNPSLAGKATFGFVSKYKKGQSTPDGDTEFQFQAAGFNFKSTSYEWLVIAGSKAQYKGSGTINGNGDFFFMLTAVDGSPDTFRMKVWDKTTLTVIYDNQITASDTADPTTALGGGSIQIHAK